LSDKYASYFSVDIFYRIAWRPWAKHFTLSVLFALIVEKFLPIRHSIWKMDCPTVKKIGTNCLPPNASPVAFPLKPVTAGSRLWITTITVNALIAHFAKRTSKAKVSLWKQASLFARVMPGWEFKIFKVFKYFRTSRYSSAKFDVFCT